MCSFLFEQRKNIKNITMDEHTISSNSSSNNVNTIINNFQGDLTDIVRLRPGGVAGLAPASSSSSNSHHHHPHLDVVSGYEEDLLLHNMSNDNTNNSSGGGGGGGGAWQLFSSADPLVMNYFGDPFSNLRPDPLLHHHMTAAAPGLFGSPNSSSPTRASDLVNGGGGGVGFCSGVNGLVGPSHEDMNMMSSTNCSGGGISGRPSCNIFSRMLQINPTSANSCSSTPTTAIASKLPCNSNTTTNTTSSSQGGDSPSPSPPPPSMAVASPRGINVNSSQQGGCLVDNNSSGGLQISSPRNPGIKRRKSQAKKVVCIPAPAAANSRATGEVVPSDLWAWRKYGQKPIKGSPYPRGYYRCSSSKGCSARKQVERSRTDPNMLVITYTSEHNHPWPTQRNALAGSTRSQPSKNTPNSIKSTPLMSSRLQKSNVSSPKEDSAHQLNNNKEMGMMTHSQNDNSNAVVGGGGSTSSATSASVKEENVDHEVHDYDHEIDEKLDQLDDSSCQDHQFNSDEVVGLFPYRPTMPGPNPTAASADQDFFADLGEIEADPLNLLFSQGFNSVDHDHQHKGMLISKGLDPFNLFDWSGGGGGGDNNNNNTNK